MYNSDLPHDEYLNSKISDYYESEYHGYVDMIEKGQNPFLDRDLFYNDFKQAMILICVLDKDGLVVKNYDNISEKFQKPDIINSIRWSDPNKKVTDWDKFEITVKKEAGGHTPTFDKYIKMKEEAANKFGYRFD